MSGRPIKRTLRDWDSSRSSCGHPGLGLSPHLLRFTQ